MSNLISRDELISDLAYVPPELLIDRNYLYARIMKLHTVDAVPIVHAEWVYDPDGMDWNLGAWKCSKCHCRNDNLPGILPKTNPYRWAGSKYCPNCGAKMGKADE